MLDFELQAYIQKMNNEKESMVARFIEQHKCLPSEVCLVEIRSADKLVYYPDFKSKYEPDASGRERGNE